MPTLINMKMDAEEAKEQSCCEAKPGDAPKYPWGLSIHLDDKALEKLSLTDPKVGTEVMIVAKATVSSCSSYQQQDGDSETSCDLQITDMTVTNGTDTLSALYPTMKK